MKKQILTMLSMSILAISFISVASAQSNEGPLRQEPNIYEDQVIICIKDVKNEAYFGQLSCKTYAMNDIVPRNKADKLYNELYDKKDTFEMGLID